MHSGIEIDFVVKDSLESLSLYKKIFDIEIIEATNFTKGKNEVIFSLYGTNFHMLDENPEYKLLAPTLKSPNSIWFNVTVEDIKSIYDKAIQNGCMEIQPITDMPHFGVSNSIFCDPFGYVWMLHQVYKEISFEDRMKLMGNL